MGHHEAIGKSNEWYTPEYIFDALECRFDLDVAAPIDRTYCCVPANDFITSNSLNSDWEGFVWMNPPFGGRNAKTPWLDKIHKHGKGIALTPDRTSAPWWQKASRECDAMLFVNGKIKFRLPGGSYGKQPGNGTTLFAYGYNAKLALLKAEENGLGICLVKLKR